MFDQKGKLKSEKSKKLLAPNFNTFYRIKKRFQNNYLKNTLNGNIFSRNLTKWKFLHFSEGYIKKEDKDRDVLLSCDPIKQIVL